MDKAFEVQRAARENVQNLKTYLTDLGNWEKEMKRKESALRGDTEQELPPVRSKVKKDKPVAKVTHKKQERIKSSDYTSWDKFDVEAACEQVDMEDVGPTSLDARRSEQVKLDKLRDEAQYEKDRGNGFVKQEKWDEAIQCYNRAIELVKTDAIYYANRGLCHLKKERLHQAESDCTEAIKLDPTYVKAYQRRAAAREKLGSLKAATQDCTKVLQIEPNNVATRKQLLALKERMATKGGKFKSSPVSTPTEDKSVTLPPSPKIVELPDEPPKLEPISTKIYTDKEKIAKADIWPDGTGDGLQLVQPIQKPPHLRSKKPLRIIPIEEIELGESEPKSDKTRRIEEGKGDFSKVETINSSPRNTQKTSLVTEIESNDNKNIKDSNKTNKVTAGIIVDANKTVNQVFKTNSSANHIDVTKFVPPTTCVQFTGEWKTFKGNDEAKRSYLNIIKPEKIPSIFQNSLESDILSEIIHTLASNPGMFKHTGVKEYLRGLASVKRFGALAMFLSQKDKEAMKFLLQHCKESEECSDDELNDLRNKFEL